MATKKVKGRLGITTIKNNGSLTKSTDRGTMGDFGGCIFFIFSTIYGIYVAGKCHAYYTPF